MATTKKGKKIMTLQELNKHIEETEELLTDVALKVQNLKNYAKEIERQQPQILKLERWKPEEKERYFYLNEQLEVCYSDYHNESSFASRRYDAFNFFQNKEEAEKEALRTRARRKLEWLARQLNAKCKPYSIVGFTLTPDFGVTVQQHNPPHLSAIYFNRREDAEYALSQMNSEELEALR
jgi:hypothetical protein